MVVVRLVLVTPIVLLILLDYGFEKPPLSRQAIHLLQLVGFCIYAIYAVLRLRAVPRWIDKVRHAWFDWLLIVIGFGDVIATLTSGVDPLEGWPWHVMEVTFVGLLAFQCMRLYVSLVHNYYTAGSLLPASFAVLIAVGTVILKVPAATPADHPIGWTDALFTATSAVCVTGLIVRDTATQFTRFGQVTILVLIQLGALGISVFGSLAAVMLGQQMTLRHALHIRGALPEQPIGHLRRLLVFIVTTTLICEAIGFAVLIGLWSNAGPRHIGLFDSLFHSVSAFCNAGFSTFSDSLVQDRSSAGVLGVISALIIIGGLGFPVLYDLFEIAQDRVKRGVRRRRSGRLPGVPHRMKLVTRLTLITTIALLISGTVLIFISQLTVRLTDAETSVIQTVLDAIFQSVTARTAGFNSMPMDELGPGSLLGLIGLMFIGGGAGSTAGGVKTITFAVAVLAMVSIWRGTPPIAWARSIGPLVIRRAATILLLMFMLIVFATIGLCISESAPVDELLFETVSAVATVGLSLGVTAKLSTVGKLIITACMFIGRVGPLALLSALMAHRMQGARYDYPTETLVLG
jgi:trk system potassium uptake protein TrkH